MTWNQQGDLFYNWCGKIVIPADKVTDHDKEFNTGYTKCSVCVGKEIPYSKRGNIEDLPDDFNPKIR